MSLQMDKRYRYTASLPLFSSVARSRGRWLSALIIVLLISPAVAADDATAQIEQAATAYLEELIAQERERNGWEELDFTLNISPLTDSTGLPPCRQSLRVVQTSGRPSALDRLRLEISCPDQSGWTQTVSTRQDLFLPVLTTAATIDRGQIIEPAHLKHQRINISRAQRGFIIDQQQVVGLSAKRRLRPDQVLNPAMLSEAAPVRRGQPVRIVARQQGIQATTQGEALADGTVGDIIRVRNGTSDRVIQAQVVGPGEVTSTWE